MRRIMMCAAMLTASAEGVAAPSPMTLAQTFEDPMAQGTAMLAPSCSVNVVALEDLRSDPQMIGVYNRRAVKAPADRQAWLRSIVDALARRGVQPQFETDAESGEGMNVGIYLERAWVSNTLNDIAVSVVFRIDEPGPNGTAEPARFRGTQQKITYFSGGEGKIQRGMDSAFAEALDAMAIHLRARCSSAQAPA